MKRTRRALIAVVAAAVAISAPHAAAKGPKAPKAKKVERVATATYQQPQQVGVNTPVGSVGYVYQEIAVPSQKGEKYASVSLEDASGQDVYFFVSQSSEPTGPGYGTGHCGSTTEPITIVPGGPVYVWMWEGTCADGTPSVATSGTVSVTFSNLP